MKRSWNVGSELTELLQELRVAQTGVQILFAFLLILPFSARFRHHRRGDIAVVTDEIAIGGEQHLAGGQLTVNVR
jgi:hypothetical protein